MRKNRRDDLAGAVDNDKQVTGEITYAAGVSNVVCLRTICRGRDAPHSDVLMRRCAQNVDSCSLTDKYLIHHLFQNS